jgi:hypothetical protein
MALLIRRYRCWRAAGGTAATVDLSLHTNSEIKVWLVDQVELLAFSHCARPNPARHVVLQRTDEVIYDDYLFTIRATFSDGTFGVKRTVPRC